MAFAHQMNRVQKPFQHNKSYHEIKVPIYIISKPGKYVLNPEKKNQIITIESECEIYISPKLNTNVVENIIVRFYKSFALVNMKDLSHHISPAAECLELRLKVKKSREAIFQYSHNCMEINAISDDGDFHCKSYGDWILLKTQT